MRLLLLIAIACAALDAGDLYKTREHMKFLRQRHEDRTSAILRDQDAVRGLDKSQIIDGPASSVQLWWRDALAKDYEQLAPMPLAAQFIRAVAEVRTPFNDEERRNQEAELVYFRSLGFNGALLVWKGENPVALIEIAKAMKRDGWTIGLTYGPEERSDRSAYVDPEKALDAFVGLLSHSTAFFPTWRKGSQPHQSHENAAKYCRIMAGIAREANPGIPIISELYLRGHKMVGHVLPCASAVVVLNAGYSKVRPDGVSRLARQLTQLPLLILVIGDVPYYSTVKEAADREVTMKSILHIEKRFTDSGYAGSVVLAGDGFGERWYKGMLRSDSLAKTEWRMKDR